jgi:hypothetical protein
MMRSVDEMIGYTLDATDGEFGSCQDLLFDDQMWTIRHITANTGLFKMGRMVLISPLMIDRPDRETRNIYLSVSKETLENCPAPKAHEPVSREHEKRIYDHFRYPYYWAGTSLWGMTNHPVIPEITEEALRRAAQEETEKIEKRNHLRSFKEVKGYHIKAKDGSIGHVQDFIIDDVTWALRYVVVDTRNWLPGGKKVMLSLNWVWSVNWTERTLEMDLTRDEIENGPKFDPEAPINVAYETKLYDYYGRPFNRTVDKASQQQIATPYF